MFILVERIGALFFSWCSSVVYSVEYSQKMFKRIYSVVRMEDNQEIKLPCFARGKAMRMTRPWSNSNSSGENKANQYKISSKEKYRRVWWYDKLYYDECKWYHAEKKKHPTLAFGKKSWGQFWRETLLHWGIEVPLIQSHLKKTQQCKKWVVKLLLVSTQYIFIVSTISAPHPQMIAWTILSWRYCFFHRHPTS